MVCQGGGGKRKNLPPLNRALMNKPTLSLCDAKLYECSLEGCARVTTTPNPSDPRLRWFIDLVLDDDDGTALMVNLCPEHVQLYLGLTEEDYVRTERAEAFVRGELNVSNVPRA
jgi:hypothetical protein